MEQQNPEKLIEAARKAQNAYQRTYRRQHPEKVKKWNASYWARRAIREAETGEKLKGGNA